MNEIIDLLTTIFVLGGIGFWVLIVAEIAFLMFCLEWERHVLAPISLLLSFFILTKFSSPEAEFNYVDFFQSLLSWQAVAIVVGYFFVGTCYTIVKWWLYCKEKRRAYIDKQRYWMKNNLRTLANDFTFEMKSWFHVSGHIDNNLRNLTNFLSNHGISDEEVKLIDKTADRATVNVAGNELLMKYSKKFEAIAAMEYSRSLIEDDVLINTLWKKSIYSNSWKIGKPDPAQHKLLIYSWIAYWPISFIWTIINDPVKHLCIQIYNSISSVLYKIADNAWKD